MFVIFVTSGAAGMGFPGTPRAVDDMSQDEGFLDIGLPVATSAPCVWRPEPDHVAGKSASLFHGFGRESNIPQQDASATRVRAAATKVSVRRPDCAIALNET